MKAKRITLRQYFTWFLWIPLGTLCLFALFFGRSGPWANAIMIALWVPVGINLLLGPTIYSFWKRKHSRVAIAILNVVLVFAGAYPGLLLWIWAFKGKEDEDVDPVEQHSSGDVNT
jgi:hypothetical protein